MTNIKKPIEYLKSGNIVRFNKGEDLYIYIPDYFGFPAFVGEYGYIKLDNYNNNLNCKNDSSYDVSHIYTTDAYGLGFSLLHPKKFKFLSLIWQRTIELTLEDIAKKYKVEKVIITNL